VSVHNTDLFRISLEDLFNNSSVEGPIADSGAKSTLGSL